MLTFFKKIRRGLLKDGPSTPTGRYIIYAIGEITLVVIGILIALQINNWNIERNENLIWDDYSSRLRADLIQDTSSLNYLLSGLNRKQEALNELKEVLMSKSIDVLDPQFLAYKLLQGEQFGWGQFTYNGTTFKDLQNTGNLRLIKDPSLRALLIDYYENWELQRARIQQRKSNFPVIVFKNIPIDFSQRSNPNQNLSEEDKNLDSRKLENDIDFAYILNLLKDPMVLSEIQHELNYVGFVGSVLTRLRDNAQSILEEFD